jgi:DNA-binding MarR family transcriptional regulator
VDATALATSLEGLLSWARRLAPTGGLSLTATATLTRLDREGPTGVSALAAVEGVTQPAMSQLVTRLERDGLVRRLGSPDDGRSVLVHLTARGERVVAERRAARAAALSELLGRATPEEAAAVRAAVPTLARLVGTGAHPSGAAPSSPATSPATTLE